MIPLSSRYAAPLLGLLALALVPITAAELRPRFVDPCLDPRALRSVERISGAKPLSERSSETSADVIQWSTGEIEGPLRLEYQVVRSYRSGVRFYQSPVSSLAESLEAEDRFVRHIETPVGTLPVWIIHDFTKGNARLAAYYFIFDREPVRQPLPRVLATSVRQLFLGSAPVTLFLVTGRASREGLDSLEERAIQWLADSWEHYVAACGSP